MNQAKSTDPTKVAKALEGIKHQRITGEVEMRADNHQLVQPLFISSFVKTGGKGVKYDVERTGMGFKTEDRGKRHRVADHVQDGTVLTVSHRA